MSWFSKIGSAISTVAKVANKALEFIKKPMESVVGPLTNVVNKVVDKLPGGIGNLVKPYVGKFLDKGLAWAAQGPLSGFMNMLNKIAPKAEKVVDILNQVDQLVNGGVKNLPEKALENARNAFAYTHAQSLLA